MGWAGTEARSGLRQCVLVLTAIAAALTITTGAADARHHRHWHHIARSYSHHDSGGGYSPPTASIVVDGNTGAVLEESNPDALRHPASLTKVMTLYLLFERLDAGKIRLDSELSVSEHAASQSPTKLGLKPGQTISVEDAIKGIVTRSANDAAVVIAENLGGSEEGFAKIMTQKAHALGMSRTTYVNASGLPDDEQITTAHDQALLGRAIQDRFPRYYRFFSTTAFVFRGQTIRGHNHLLGSVPGVDGIKTGFTNSSGFNLLTSVHRDGRYLIGVVLGGRSAGERDAHMRALVESNILLASARRTAPVIADRGPMTMAGPTTIAMAAPVVAPSHLSAAKAQARDFAKPAAPARGAPAVTASSGGHTVVGTNDPIRPLIVRTVTYHTVTVHSPTMRPMPVMVPSTQPTVVAAREMPAPAPARALQVQAAPPVVASAAPVQVIAPAKPEPGPPAASAVGYQLASASSVVIPASHAHNGWVIQIGAYGAEDEARQHLSEAKLKLHAALASADPFTERVQKGDATFYRARFAGFDKATAEAACRQLKRNDFACITVKD
jgi:D-alanyl-D-alanine carboxypeptidase